MGKGNAPQDPLFDNMPEGKKLYRQIFEKNLDPLFLSDIEGNIYHANPAACQLFERTEEELSNLGSSSIVDTTDKNYKIGFTEFNKKGYSRGELTGIRKDGTRFPIEIAANLFVDHRERPRISIFVHDITEQKKAQQDILKLNRVYTVISHINKAIVRLDDSGKIYDEACHIAVKYGKFRMAWVGLFDDKKHLLKPISIKGHEAGYLSTMNRTFSETGMAIKSPPMVNLLSGKHYVCNDIVDYPVDNIWKEEALKRGYKSYITLPVKLFDKTIGAYTLYSGEKDFFNPQEIELLEGIANDISYAISALETEKDWQEAVKALSESEQRYKILTESMKDVIWTMDTDTLQFLYVSPSIEKLRGYSLEEVLKEPLDELLSSPQREELLTQLSTEKENFLAGRITSEDYFIHEIEQPCKDGSWVTTEIITNFIKDPVSGKIELHGVTRDITERKRAEEMIRKSESRLKRAEIASLSGNWELHLETKTIHASEGAVKLYGAPLGDLTYESVKKFPLPEYRPMMDKALKNLIENNIPYNIEFKIRKGDTGEIRDMHSTASYDPEKKIILGIIRDITEQKRAEEMILKSESRLKRAEIVSQSGNWELHLDSNTLIASDGATRLYGASVSQMSFDKVKELTLPQYRQMLDKAMKDLTEKQKPYDVELKIRTADTNEIRDIHSTATFDPKENIVFGIVQDITEWKKKEKEVLMLGKAIQQSPSAIIITNADGNIEFVNHKFTGITQYTLNDVRFKKPRIFNPGHLSNEQFQKMWKDLLNGKDWKGEFLNRRKDKSEFWSNVSISPILGEEGQISNYILIMEDISMKKQMMNDLIEAKEKAEESDRLKSAFLANMSHEIRTPLNSIIGFSELMIDSDYDELEKLNFYERIKTSGQNLISILSNIVDISKIEAGQMKVYKSVISVKYFMGDLKSEYAYKAKNKGIDFKLLLENIDENTSIESDETKIKQVLINLTENALKFTSEGSLELGAKDAGKDIRFHVRDTGIGIPKEFHDKIFERFRQVEMSSTRQFGGNGLGLAISKNLVEMLGGTICLESDGGTGTTFYFTIPKKRD